MRTTDTFPGSDEDVLEMENLKGSCPFLYTWDGERFRFVTDAQSHGRGAQRADPETRLAKELAACRGGHFLVLHLFLPLILYRLRIQQIFA